MSSVGPSLISDFLSKASDLVFASNRLKTFNNNNEWPYDEGNNLCTSVNLAAAGFVCTATKDEPCSAQCPFCEKELVFDATDDPWDEHRNRCPSCPFVTLGKLNESDWLVKDYLELAGSLYALEKKGEWLNYLSQFEKAFAEVKAMSEKKMNIKH